MELVTRQDQPAAVVNGAGLEDGVERELSVDQDSGGVRGQDACSRHFEVRECLIGDNGMAGRLEHQAHRLALVHGQHGEPA